MTVFQLLSLLFLVLTLLFSYSVIITKIRLERSAKRERDDSLGGSSVCHGMTFKEEGRGVNRGEQYSYTWYERLLG